MKKYLKNVLAAMFACLLVVGLIPTVALADDVQERAGGNQGGSTTIPMGAYNMYHYALIPGSDADANTDPNTRWFGVGVDNGQLPNPGQYLRVYGENAEYNGNYAANPDATGTDLKSLYPDITWQNVTYHYAAPGSDNVDTAGYYTLAVMRTRVSYGANAGYNGYNSETNNVSWHRDYLIVLNEASYCTVSYMYKYEGDSEFRAIENYAQRVTVNTPESSVKKALLADVEGYKFLGWYTDEECKNPATFSGTITENTTYYGKYVPVSSSVTYTVVGGGGKVRLDDSSKLTDVSVSETVEWGNNAVGAYPIADEGYEFVGWFTDEACTTPVTGIVGSDDKIAPTNVTAAVTYYAKFEQCAKLTLKKEVLGNAADPLRHYTVVVSGLPAGSYSISYNDEAGNTTVEGTGDETVHPTAITLSQNENLELQLKAGEIATISGIPRVAFGISETPVVFVQETGIPNVAYVGVQTAVAGPGGMSALHRDGYFPVLDSDSAPETEGLEDQSANTENGWLGGLVSEDDVIGGSSDTASESLYSTQMAVTFASGETTTVTFTNYCAAAPAAALDFDVLPYAGLFSIAALGLGALLFQRRRDAMRSVNDAWKE